MCVYVRVCVPQTENAPSICCRPALTGSSPSESVLYGSSSSNWIEKRHNYVHEAYEGINTKIRVMNMINMMSLGFNKYQKKN